MKKTSILFAICVMATSLFAQMSRNQPVSSFSKRVAAIENALLNQEPNRNYLYRYDGYTSSDDYEEMTYTYLPNGWCSVIDVRDGFGTSPSDLIYYDTITYDANGHVIRLDEHQLLNGNWIHANYVVYTYNEQGLMATRTNYNNFGGNFEAGGTYTYIYNADGQMISADLTMGGMVYTSESYEYADGKLLRVNYLSYSFDTYSMEPVGKLEYIYNAAGLLSRVETYDYTGDWTYSGCDSYTYDEDGNCTEFCSTDAQGTVTKRYLYEYTRKLRSETFIPQIPEFPFRVYDNQNVYDIMHYYGQDANFTLVYVCDYYYRYGTYVSVADEAMPQLACYPNPANDKLVVEGENGDNLLRIYDLQGRCVKSQRLSGAMHTVDVSALPAGSYVVRVEGASPRASKLMIVR